MLSCLQLRKNKFHVFFIVCFLNKESFYISFTNRYIFYLVYKRGFNIELLLTIYLEVITTKIFYKNIHVKITYVIADTFGNSDCASTFYINRTYFDVINIESVFVKKFLWTYWDSKFYHNKYWYEIQKKSWFWRLLREDVWKKTFILLVLKLRIEKLIEL